MCAAAQASPSARTTLFFDAVATHATTAGGPPTSVGHQQIGSGILYDAAGRSVGRFSFTCVWVETLPNGDARERCSDRTTTADGRLTAAGPSRRSDATHTWAISSGTERYRGARGTVVVRDLGPTETLVTVTIRPRTGVTLHTGVLARAISNRRFIDSANALCTTAATRLNALPPFPFSNFDPLHPDPRLLPKVGRFFTGQGDPRPILRALNSGLRALGQPPASAASWTHVLGARAAALKVNSEQDSAAVTANVAGFIKSVHAVDNTSRQVAITATIFGVPDCVL
jgi:allene oxide cyclase-like protein